MSLNTVAVVLLALIVATPLVAQQKARARSLGIVVGSLEPGPLDAITDVPGVRVGQATVIEGDSVRTGVTAVLAHGGNAFQERVPAALHVGNGFGKLAGVTQLRELIGRKYAWAKPFMENASVAEMADVPTLLGRLTGFASRTFGVVVNVVVVIIIGIYLAAAPKANLDGVVSLFPPRRRERTREVLIEVGETMHLWMVGQLIPMIAIAVLTTVGLWILRVDLAVTIGILAGLFNFIPNFGPLLALVPAALVALSDGPEKVLWVVGLFIFAQSLEGYVITPLVQQRMVQLPPAVTIAMQVVMGLLVGGIGVALAAPLTAAALVLVKMLYVEDVLKEPTELPSEQAERRKEEKEEAREDGG